MSKEGRICFSVALGIAILMIAVLAHVWRQQDAPPATAIPDFMGATVTTPRASRVQNQPTVIQADAALSPLAEHEGAQVLGHNRGQLNQTSSSQTNVWDRPPQPAAGERPCEDFLPIPPAHRLEQP